MPTCWMKRRAKGIRARGEKKGRGGEKLMMRKKAEVGRN